ncbi:hypothetical protein GCM10010531_34020 [Blastococcus jejuensis]|uniref:Uncharacterized protein n=1 Tax=Blastococcus jejuensis TaxID=351224 RepID=A0ABP6PGJ9_9ACTN
MGTSGAGFPPRLGLAAGRRRALADVVRFPVVVLVLRRRRPGMGLPLVLRHGKRRHRRNV